MSRTISTAFLEAINAQETDEVVICLLTITHDDIEDAIYLSSDATTRISDDPLVYVTASRGNNHLYLPFTFTMPDDKSDSPPRIQIAFDNIDRTMVTLLRSVSSPVDVKVEIILASSPDVVEIEMPVMQLSDVSIKADIIGGTLVVDSLVNEPYPAGSFTPSNFPGIF
ncbi:MAG: DUF1833 family protein [Lentilitoribacter sp.]